jgi:hypothetical protein
MTIRSLPIKQRVLVAVRTHPDIVPHRLIRVTRRQLLRLSYKLRESSDMAAARSASKHQLWLLELGTRAQP